jgi:hypothetical protein
MEDNNTQVKSLNGHFALLQQTLPHGNQLSVTMTEENLQNLGDVTFGQMLLDVDKSFKGSCAPYQELGSSQRERLFLRTLRSRVPLRTSYLSSVALDALSEHASSGFRPSEHPPLHTCGSLLLLRVARDRYYGSCLAPVNATVLQKIS